MGADLIEARLNVDDSDREDGMVTMKCLFPVAVYPCYDDDIVLDEWAGACLHLASVPQYPDSTWPLREDDPELICYEAGTLFFGSKCSDPEWQCSTGLCDAYEKTARLCAGILRLHPYPCFTLHDSPSAGIREEHTGFPVWWCVGGVITSSLTLCTCAVCIAAMSGTGSIGEVLLKTLVSLASMFAIGLVCSLLAQAIGGGADKDPVLGPTETSYTDLVVAAGGSNTTAEALFVAKEAPPPSGLSTLGVVLVVVGSIFGALCLVCMVIACTERCKASGYKARQKALAEIEARVAADGLQAGMSVMLTDDCIDHDSDAMRGCLQPGQVGKLLENDGSSKPYQVEYENEKWYYRVGALKAVRQETDHLSSATSRANMNNVVREASDLNITQTIGHRILYEMEGQRLFAQRVGSKANLLASRSSLTKDLELSQQKEAPEGFAPVPETFKLQKGDEVAVRSSLATVQCLNGDAGVLWCDEKAARLGQTGVVVGQDWLGPGIRVRFQDGHWWSYHPQALCAKLDALSSERRAALESALPPAASPPEKEDVVI